jgi:hypothetical protein
MHVTISNLYGAVISERDLEGSIKEFTEDISRLQHGFYFISFSTDTHQQSLQFQKK